MLDWVDDSTPYKIRVVGGAGGTGKTRLAVELCEHFRVHGWLCGLLQASDREQLETLTDTPVSRLIVVDYAETRSEQLEALLPEIAPRATTEARVRVVLLVRTAPRPDETWTDSLRTRSDDLDVCLDEASELALAESSVFDLEARRQLFTAMTLALGELEIVSACPDHIPDLSAETFETPLMVSIAAYLACVDGPTLPTYRSQLLDAVVVHEARHWMTPSIEPAPNDKLCRRVVALAALTGADTRTEAVELLSILPELKNATAERRYQLADWIHGLYSQPRWWQPIEPDLLAEHLVRTELAAEMKIIETVLTQANVTSVAHALELLSRASAYDDDVQGVVRGVLSGALTRLVTKAVEQAASTSASSLLDTRSLAGAIERAVPFAAIEKSKVVEALALLPDKPHMILSPLALALTGVHVNLLRKLAASDPITYLADLALSLDNLANWLAEVGRPTDAVAACEEAVACYRELAKTDPASNLSMLGISLNSLAVRLAGIGNRTSAISAAEEATDLFRSQALGNTGHTPYLVSALHTLASRLADADRRTDAAAVAREATERYIDVMRTRSVISAADLLAALDLLDLLAETSGYDEVSLNSVERVLEWLREMAREDAAHLPALASALDRHANRLSQMGRPDIALPFIQDAVRIFGGLTEENAAYLDDRARSVSHLSASYSALGYQDSALIAAKVAVQDYRILAKVSPDRYRHVLAGSLNTVSNRFADVGQHIEALDAIREAAQDFRELTDDSQGAHLSEFAMTLNNFAIRLSAVGRDDDAIENAQEAAQYYRELANSTPHLYLPDLAMSLLNLAVLLWRTGRRQEALDPAEQAAAHYMQLALDEPGQYDAQLSRAMTVHGNLLREVREGST